MACAAAQWQLLDREGGGQAASGTTATVAKMIWMLSGWQTWELLETISRTNAFVRKVQY
ncbi:hypothetical protein J2S43_007195 [Catenuloplanes nepalensis]|uniref:Uncharacterized protein n=1 Tax=Catenuloplanes nepalensis TaxID=587533 RepID=A0ABT9N4Q4_9ACTN|nr:hypothetical protein [Catenuloplanes nepalensis]